MSRELGGKRRVPFVAASFALAALVFACLPRLASLFEDVESFSAVLAEPWRVWTSHLAHRSWAHAFLGIALFLPLAIRHERSYGHASLAFSYAVLACLVAGTVRLCHGNWESYRGLSGIIYGLLALDLLRPERGRARRDRFPGALRDNPLYRVAVTLALLAKTALELAIAPAGMADGFYAHLSCRYLPGSHLGGLLGGFGLAGFAHWRSRDRAEAVTPESQWRSNVAWPLAGETIAFPIAEALES